MLSILHIWQNFYIFSDCDATSHGIICEEGSGRIYSFIAHVYAHCHHLQHHVHKAFAWLSFCKKLNSMMTSHLLVKFIKAMPASCFPVSAKFDRSEQFHSKQVFEPLEGLFLLTGQ